MATGTVMGVGVVGSAWWCGRGMKGLWPTVARIASSLICCQVTTAAVMNSIAMAHPILRKQSDASMGHAITESGHPDEQNAIQSTLYLNQVHGTI
jgi:hypothetical protein